MPWQSIQKSLGCTPLLLSPASSCLWGVAGTAQVGVSLVSFFDPLCKQSRLHCLDVCLTWYLWHIKGRASAHGPGYLQPRGFFCKSNFFIVLHLDAATLWHSHTWTQPVLDTPLPGPFENRPGLFEIISDWVVSKRPKPQPRQRPARQNPNFSHVQRVRCPTPHLNELHGWQCLHWQFGYHPGTLPYPTCCVYLLCLFC